MTSKLDCVFFFVLFFINLLRNRLQIHPCIHQCIKIITEQNIHTEFRKEITNKKESKS